METPVISTGTYSTSTVDPRLAMGNVVLGGRTVTEPSLLDAFVAQEPNRNVRALLKAQAIPQTFRGAEPMSFRYVKVFIADPNENVPLAKRMLFEGPEHLTDLTDQELFFEVPMAELLKAHNEMRAATLDKKASEKSGRDVFLEPVRIRDLRMVVVTVAQF